MPYNQASVTDNKWHYIDCAAGGVVVEYAHSMDPRPVAGAYYGGVYAPSLDRIYMVPF